MVRDVAEMCDLRVILFPPQKNLYQLEHQNRFFDKILLQYDDHGV